MNPARIFLCCFLICLLPQTCRAQKYYSDDGLYVAEVQQIKQTPSQEDPTWIDVNLFMYVHLVTDKTPFKKASPLRQDRLVGVFLGNVITGNEPLSPPHDDVNGGGVYGDRSAVSIGVSVGKVRAVLPSVDFTVTLLQSPVWRFVSEEVAEGKNKIDIGPVTYDTTTDKRGLHVSVQIIEADALPKGGVLDLKYYRWMDRFYGLEYLSIVGAKGHILSETGGDSDGYTETEDYVTGQEKIRETANSDGKPVFEFYQ